MKTEMPDTYLPAARTSKLLVRELADETLVYDQDGHRAHCLNPTAALVWRLCDGKPPAPRIAERVGESLSAAVHEEVVWRALEQLAEYDLLAPGAACAPAPKLISRRRMIR